MISSTGLPAPLVKSLNDLVNQCREIVEQNQKLLNASEAPGPEITSSKVWSHPECEVDDTETLASRSKLEDSSKQAEHTQKLLNASEAPGPEITSSKIWSHPECEVDDTETLSSRSKLEDSSKQDHQNSYDGNVAKTHTTKVPNFRVSRILGLDWEASKQEIEDRLTGRLFLEDHDLSIGDRSSCFLENIVATNPHAYFHLLFIAIVIFTLAFGFAWFKSQDDEDPYSVWQNFYFAFQQISTAGIDTDISEPVRIIIHILMSFFGLIVFAVLVGMITETFSAQAEEFKMGKTKVSDKGHTLVLGWNEATLRLICQIAFLRQQWRAQNDTWSRKIFWWTRVPPSTPVAKSSVVIMCDSMAKDDMQAQIEDAFVERGICKKRTRVGWDVICRVGDPTNVRDLQRVGAHRATAIVVQTTERDMIEADLHEGVVQNGATLRTLLSLRAVLFSSKVKPDWDNLRICVQLTTPSKAIDAATFRSPNGQPLVLIQDLTVFLNSLMLTCIAKQGLAEVLMDLLGFDGVAMRARDVDTFPESTQEQLIGKTVSECAFLWEDGILLGVIDPYTSEDQSRGIAPIEPTHKITYSDRIAFVSISSVPTLADPGLHQVGPLTGMWCVDKKCPQHVLVCGWRQAWTDEPMRFAMRLRGVCKEMSPGSSVMFLNLVDTGAFKALLDSLVDESGRALLKPNGDEKTWTFCDKVEICHVHGDASVYDCLHDVLKSARDQRRPYSHAIILTTAAEKDVGKMSPESRDTRMMSIMLMMKYLVALFHLPTVHIIGENALDSTSCLTLVPRGADDTSDAPDFINVQAIYARALSQALAYPRMNLAIHQLFSQEPGTPEVVFKNAISYIPVGHFVLFAEVVATLKARPDSVNDICIGWIDKRGVEYELVPRLSSSRVYAADDRLIVVTRSVEGGASRNSPASASTSAPSSPFLS